MHLKQTCCVWGPGPRLQGEQGGPLHAQTWAATQRGPAAAGQDALCALHTQQLFKLSILMRCLKLALQRQPQTLVRRVCCMLSEEPCHVMRLVNTNKVGTACNRAEAQNSNRWCVKPLLVQKLPCKSINSMILCMQIHDYMDITVSIFTDQACSYCTLMQDIQPLKYLQQLCTKLILIHYALSVGCCCLNACPSVEPCSQLKMEDCTVQPASLYTVASPRMS